MNQSDNWILNSGKLVEFPFDSHLAVFIVQLDVYSIYTLYMNGVEVTYSTKQLCNHSTVMCKGLRYLQK